MVGGAIFVYPRRDDPKGNEVQVDLVDPRGADGEVLKPVHRVYFSDSETAQREVRITDAQDIIEVLRWADGIRVPSAQAK